MPHIFHEEFKEDRFVWMAMSFSKSAKKGERLAKVKTCRGAPVTFRNEGTFDGTFTEFTGASTVTKTNIETFINTGIHPGRTKRAFEVSNFKITAVPSIWVRSPTQTIGEHDEVAGFPILPLE